MSTTEVQVPQVPGIGLPFDHYAELSAKQQ